MNTVIRTTLIILLLAAFPASIKAQEDLHSASVFQKYGKQKGVTMVELSRDMLDSYRIDLYRSLVFKDVTEALPYILDCLEKDQKEGTMKKIQEIIEDCLLPTHSGEKRQRETEPFPPVQDREEKQRYLNLYRRQSEFGRACSTLIPKKKLKQ